MRLFFRSNTAILLIFLLLAQAVSARQKFYNIQFTDKKNSPYSLEDPLAFLSQRALDRRALYQIPVDSADLPVNPQYLAALKDLGFRIHSTSRWMNTATILCDSIDPVFLADIPNISSIEYTGLEGEAPAALSKAPALTDSIDYGTAQMQIEQLNADKLHNAGYMGKGILVSIIDGGFNSANINPAFSTARNEDRILGWKNIIYPDSSVYGFHVHGANVLSIMTGQLPGEYTGIAPEASYYLILSEYTPTEYKCEVDFWVSAIEFADSIGTDVVNSSLGYAYFDDPSMDFTYSDLNGMVSRASKAAHIASQKGMIVVVSAGNEGNKAWKYIGSPADAEDILAVGSVYADGMASTFSSYGPSADGRVKPDISARGSYTALVNSSGTLTNGSGTSYSSPLACGAMACLLNYARDQRPDLKPYDLMQLVRESGDLYQQPDSQMGYGIPDFEKVVYNMTTGIHSSDRSPDFPKIHSMNNGRVIELSFSENGGTAEIFSIQGQKIHEQSSSDSVIKIMLPSAPAGIYLLRIQNGNKEKTFKLLLQ